MEDAGKSLDEMEAEARSAPLKFRAEMLANVRKYRRDVNSLQTRFNKARTERSVGGGNYGTSLGAELPGVTDQYRQQVVAGTQVLARTGDSINRAQQVAIETDQVGQLRSYLRVV